MDAQANRLEVSIPRLASLYLTHSWDGKIGGLRSVAPADQPYVPLVFFAFRIMVGVGLILLAIAVTGAFLRWRGRLYDAPWFQKVAMAATPLGFVAVLAGWTVTEAGRQPFVVYGHLRTADAVSPISADAVTSTLLLFFIVYNVVLLAFLWFAARTVLKGPARTGMTEQSPKPGLDRAAPAVGGARPADPYGGPLPSPGE
jgi:cytochrome bd ubiquinol oxidase subunit I